MSTYERPANDRQPLFFRTTRCNNPFARPRDVLPQTLQLIKSAHRLHIFGIRRFDNTKCFKIDKRISLREIFIEIDHFPIQPFHCCAQSFPPPSPLTLLCFVCRLSSETNFDPFLCFKIPKHKKFGPTLCFVSFIRKGFDKK